MMNIPRIFLNIKLGFYVNLLESLPSLSQKLCFPQSKNTNDIDTDKKILVPSFHFLTFCKQRNILFDCDIAMRVKHIFIELKSYLTVEVLL